MAEFVGAGLVERRPAWRLQGDTGEVFFAPGPGRVRTSNRYRVVARVGATSDPQVGATSDPQVGARVGARVGTTSGPRSNYRKKELQKESIPSAVSANSHRPAAGGEERQRLDSIIEAVRARRTPPLSRSQAVKARAIATDRLRADWSPDQVIAVLVETSAFTDNAVDFAASGPKRRGRARPPPSAARRSSTRASGASGDPPAGAQVVGVLLLATGREVTHEVIDAWAVALAKVPDGDDGIEVESGIARGHDYVTLAQFYEELRSTRRRRALPGAPVSSRASHHRTASPKRWLPFGRGSPLRGGRSPPGARCGRARGR